MHIIEKDVHDQSLSRCDIDLTGRPTLLKHLAFHWVQQFSIFMFSKLGVVTPNTATEGSPLWSLKLNYAILHWDRQNLASPEKLT